jgi:hypothetical protein
MAKRASTSTSKPVNVKKTLHLDALADGVLDSLAVVRQKTVSAVVCELLLAELHNTQGTEREAIRAILTARGIEIPRKRSGTSDGGRAVGGLPESVDQPTVSIPRSPQTVASRISQIVRSSGMPIDNAIESFGDDSGQP